MSINFYEQSFFRRSLYLVVALFFLSYSAVQAQQYDLSLAKSVDLDSVGIGDQVVFTTIVTNDGDDVTNIDVTFQPFPGTTLITTSGTGTYTSGVWSVPALASGAMASLDITWQIDTVGVFYCAGEITSFSDAGGLTVSDSDSSPGNGVLAEDDIASACTSVPIDLCPSLGETVTLTAPNGYPSYTWYRVYDSNANGMLDTVSVADAQEVTIGDFGKYFYTAEDASGCGLGSCCPVIIDNKCFDLALTKITSVSGVTLGDVVPFTINVANQGDIDAENVEVIDYIPSGLSYDAANNAGLGWTVSGANVVTTIGDLDVGATASLTINLTVIDLEGDLINASEITGAVDDNGNPQTDEDSTPDTDNGDQLIDREGTTDHVDIDFDADDEDDHDVAEVRPAGFDLALNKLVTSTGPFTAGDKVTFTIQVANQGIVDAQFIEVIDYIPSGFTFLSADNPSWTGVNAAPGGTAMNRTITNLDAGQATSVTIVLTINSSAGGVDGNLVNAAEIASAQNDNGEMPMDEDSNPDTVNGDMVTDQTADEHITVDNAPDDEDDHDIAEIMLASFDLALSKLTTATEVTLGEKVTFTINVANQGMVDAANVEVVDYIPTGFTYMAADNTGWTGVDGDLEVLATIADLDAGAATTLTIVLTVTDLTASLTNAAEVSEAENDNGLNPVDEDSFPDDTNGDQVVDQTGATDHIDIDNGPDDEDDHDIATVTPAVFDLALSKLTTSNVVTLGDLVPFTINVANQGTVDAQNITVTDYIPSGFTYMAADNTGWTGANGTTSGMVSTTIADLDAGAATTVTINLIVSDLNANLENAAEISAAENDFGQSPADEDSTPDTTNGDQVVDQTGATDHIDIDNGPDDEDDHDVAEVRPAGFDLALNKLVSNTMVTFGDKVTFTIQVGNQGVVDAQNVEVTDYIPSGFTFYMADNPTWMGTDGMAGGTATTTVADLDAGQGAVVSIVLTVNDTAGSIAGDLTNAAEISYSENDNGETPLDEDSDADNVNGDPVVDQFSNEHLTLDDGADDEDDHDIAVVEMAEFDLALIKLTSAANVTLGDVILFTIQVKNQGDVDAQNIDVIDYIPTGLSFPVADIRNTAWSVITPSTVEAQVADLDAGMETSIDIWLEVISEDPAEWVNASEITAAENDNGEEPLDIDSTPDDVNADDVVDRENPTDNDTYDDEPNDEDDHDIAVPSTGTFDLALIKLTTTTVAQIGDDVPFEVKVANQGTIDAENISIIDYIPSGFDYDPANNAGSNWTVSGTDVMHVIGDLNAGTDTILNIVLTVNNTVVNTTGSLINTAEITEAFNDAGGQPEDEDSVPDNDNGDALVDRTDRDDHINIDDAQDDEDDHDIAVVPIELVDLAINKVNDSMNAIQGGDDVTWTITVYNQGNVTMQNVQIVDYLPDFFILSPADTYLWSAGPTATSVVNTVAGPLEPGEFATIKIITRADLLIPSGGYQNTVEIFASEDEAGNDRTDDDIDSTADQTEGNDNQVNDEIFGDAIDEAGEDEDDEDPAYVNVDVFDLALRKTTEHTEPVQWGEDVTFTITIFNQGSITATDVDVIDYIPTGFILSPNDFNGWSYTTGSSNLITNTFGSILLPSDSLKIDVVLQVVPGAQLNVMENNAEITHAEDENGNVQDNEDVDSTPDDINGNDTEVDDMITDNGSTDEDDHDPEEPPVFDLALRKTVDANVIARIGDDVDYRITIFNQGNMTAANVEVTDYLPTGFVLSPNDTNGWATDGVTATTVVAGPLVRDDSMFVDITLRVTNLAHTGNLINFAEISAAQDDMGNDRTDDDIDSTTDGDNTNDILDDNVITENTIIDGSDEDDHDMAVINIYDLAIRKTPVLPDTVTWLDDVMFTFTIFNQGSNITAQNIEVIDYIPTGFILSPNDTNGWLASGDGTTASNTVGGPLVVGDSVAVNILLQVERNTPAGFHYNHGEITGSSDLAGNDMTGMDYDSNDDSTYGDDTEIDNDIDGHAVNDPADDADDSEDEDDADVAPVFVEIFDLALRKTTNQEGPVLWGDDVTFFVTVFNQGSIDAYDVRVIDHIPAGFFLSQSDTNSWVPFGSVMTNVIPGPIAVGDSAVLEMVLTVQEGASAYSFDNIAEIFAAEDIDGDDRTNDDVDSTPDTNRNNDNLDDNVIDGDVVGISTDDEDDHDIAFVDIYDLALRKTTPQITPVQPYDDVLFVIEVFNQGSITAANIDLVDYIPTGFMLSPNETNWTLSADGMSATQTYAGPLAPQDTALVTILLQVTPGVADVIGNTSTVLYNDAEISGSEDDMGNDMSQFDVDSTPDDENGNDLTFDDEINDDGGFDEDDHDIAGVMVEIVDLALRKTTTITNPVQIGDDVVFAIEIFNQGTIPAVNVEVTDHLPAGVILSPTDGNGWTADATGTILTNTIAAVIPPGNSLSIGVVVQVTADASSSDIVNLAEITYHEDPFGEDRTDQDYDSTSDDNPDNDVNENDEINDDTVANPGQDEDDHDGESLYIFDLALEKTTNQIDPVNPGDDVVFYIEVFNQGVITATNVDVIDYLPAGFMLSPADTNGWAASADGTTATNLIAGPLTGGTSTTLEIVLQVMPQPMGGTFNNVAEISGAQDENGMEIGDQDWDSTPDEIAGNDPQIDGEIFDNGTNDEDDQDPAPVTIEVIDIALIKVIDPSTPMPVQIGDEIIFNITLTNQGSIDLYNVDLVDYIPSGYALSASDANGWIAGPNNTATVTYNGPLLGNTSITLGIVVDVLPTAPVGLSYNFAEVVSMEDATGIDVTNEDIDSDGDNDPNNDGPWTDNETGNENDDEDDHDGAHVVLDGFDLALTKTLADGQAAAVNPGDDVTFTVTVYNQGEQNAFSVDIVDYIPANLTLNDADWATSGTNATYSVNSILSGDSAKIDITFTVDPDFEGTSIINFAEIAAANDPTGNPGDDVDSTPDSMDDNDTYATDNEVGGDANNGGDEDDHDPAEVMIIQPLYDLALTKTLAVGQDPMVKPGDDVTFAVTVYNQGDSDAYDIMLIDYVPVQMSLNDGDWTAAGTDATFEIDFIAVGDSAIVDITLMVNDTYLGTQLINYAEITQFAGEDNGSPVSDVDSTPDNVQDNDAGGTNESPEDDHIDDDGMDTDGDGITDEDDHDPASINVEQPFFDLALTKVLADGQRDTVTAGDEVTYTITVYNQANTDAYDVDIVDYVPVQMSLSDGDWTYNGSDATYTVDYIAAGDSALVDITLMLNATFTGGSLVNYAEIMDGSQTDGGPTAIDVDSTPDNDDDNDAGGTPDSDQDNHVADDGTDTDGDGITDEDDHDPASIAIVPSVTDLALIKTFAAGQALGADPGEDVMFTITVFNQGTEDAYNVDIIDYIPTGLILNDADWTTDGTNAIFTLAGPLVWGDQVSIDVTFTVDPNHPMGTSIINFAEIADFEDANGDHPMDVDSTPDSDDTNDNGGLVDTATDNNVDNGTDPSCCEYTAMTELANVATVLADGSESNDISEISIDGAALILPYPYHSYGTGIDDLVADVATQGYTLTYSYAPNPQDTAGQILSLVLTGGELTGVSVLDTLSTTTITGGDGVCCLADEDDHDPVEIEIGQMFDLALVKTLPAGAPAVFIPGGDVTFEVIVTNQGNIDAYDIDIVDYIPANLILNDADWTADAGNAVYTLDFLEAYATTSVMITLTVDPTFTGSSITNVAEITDATDEDGGETREDDDSTPDSDDTNDGAPEDDVTDNTNDDEDDHDPETIVVEQQGFDLALRKTLADGQAAVVNPGDDVTFTVTVFNQGNVDAYDVDIIDYVPVSMSLNDSDWYAVSSNAGYTVDLLAAGDSIAIDITLNVNGSFTGNMATNFAEILDASETDGGPTAIDIDSAPDDENENDGYQDEDDNEIHEDGTNGGDEDDHDPETVTVIPYQYDLAIRKTISTDQVMPISPGDDVTFTLEVFNQGARPAYNVDVVDYIPTGLTLNDADWIMAGANATTTLAGPVMVGGSMTVDVTFTIDTEFLGASIENEAEISDFEDVDGNHPEDEDSTPNDDPSDDPLVDNEIDDDGTIDEDDNDIEVIELEHIFDLALTKTLIAGQENPVSTGDDVTFTVTVINQGTMTAQNIDLIDYVPAGMTLDTSSVVNSLAGWVQEITCLGDPVVCKEVSFGSLAGPLAAGQSMTVDVVYTITGVYSEVTDLQNFAEITSAEDTQGNMPEDIDSTPDADDSNDTYTTNDETDGDGMNNGDEDDHDPEIITVDPTYFDLALNKVITAGQATVFAAGDDVTFTINVFNQGTEVAYNIDVVDYIPTGLTLNDADWTMDGANAVYALAGPLAAGATESVDVTFTIDTGFAGTSIVNEAEISDFEDVDGNHPNDGDSTPDSDPSNDLVVDNETNDDGTVDEDDHDPEAITVFTPVYDLALNKAFSDDQVTPINLGDTVTYTISIINEGNVSAYNVEVTDYIPEGLILIDTDWTIVGANAVTTIAGELVAGTTAAVDITFMVDPTFEGTTVVNTAEISDFENEDGETPDDEDSDPNDDPSDDEDGEDDNDDEIFDLPTVFDLALVKRLAEGQSNMVSAGDDVTYTITVYNQGSLGAFNIEVTDYVPAEMSLNDSDWATSFSNAITTIDFLASGDSVNIDITLMVNETFIGTSITNYAEISNADDDNDPTNEGPVDGDSTPDSDPSNDPVINDENNNPADEDDHDPEVIEVIEDFTFDLALNKALSSDQNSPVAPGDTVTFTITVYNQGTGAAYDVDVVDYIPTGLILADANWTGNGTTATSTIAGPILPNNAASLDVTFVVDANFMGTSLENVAEITHFHDEDGNDPVDEDSTPDNDPDNDPEINDEIDNPADEDDADPEVIEVEQTFDLALVKTLATGQATAVMPGDDVTFTITVHNQGTLDAYNVDVIDYIPAQMSLNDSNWGTQFSYATNTIAFVPAGGTASVDITLMVNETFSGSSITNYAEISGADNDEDSTNEDPVDEDSTPDNDPSDDPVVDNEIDDDGTNDEDDHDPEVITVTQPEFDLALVKTLAEGQAAMVTPGSNVEYTITVINQGMIDAYDVDIVDYIPANMSLNDGNWGTEGSYAVYTMDFVAAGTSVDVNITLMVNNNFESGDITNYAEITEASDETGGDPVEDTDSTPDSDPSNDPVVDNETNDDGTNDEDDHDPEVITVVPDIFDLALNKTLADIQSTMVVPGEDVTFTITVFNQGTGDAYGVDIIDHIPDELTLNDNDWTVDNGNAIFTIPFLAAGAQAAIDVTFTVDPAFMGTAITNIAEITDFEDENGNDQDDIDSTPDEDPKNDPTVDDEINDDGTEDEDDHDPEVISVDQTFDLALIKSLALGQATLVEPGADVTFTVSVFNQGTLDAYDVDVVDYIPEGMFLNDADWIGTVNGAETTIAYVAAGEFVSVDITLMVSEDYEGTSITNMAEITEASDETGGDPVEDTDSTPDSDPSNDPVIDNEIDDPADEDDHDPEVIEIDQSVFDLALTKSLAEGQAAAVMPGDDVTFTITVTNEGNVDAYNVAVADYIPAVMSLNDSDWGTMGSNATTTIAFVAAGESVSVDITMTVNNNFTGTSITNNAEITSADDDEDPTNEDPTDEDSDPDTDSTNDNPSDGDPTNDEDDHDDEVINVNEGAFDLAIEKSVSPDQVTPVQAGDDVTFIITVTNEGTIDAYDVDVVDYIPSQMTLNDSDWTLVGGNALNTIEFVRAGYSVSVYITLTINDDFTGMSITNVSEIAEATDEPGGDPVVDVDSTPDTDPTNDDPTDDNPDNDEDDTDPAVIDVVQPSFDLALVKSIAQGQSTPFSVGGDVTFTITVYNQGMVDAYDVDVVDYIPTGLILNDTDWSTNGANAINMISYVEAGTSESVDITFTIDPNFTGTSIVNTAEIEDATNTNGGDTTDDLDSTPDNDIANDPLVDNELNDNGTIDEDDHDIAEIVIEQIVCVDVVASDDVEVCQGETAQLTATVTGDNVTYSWTPSLGLSCVNCANPIASPNQSVNYQVTATSDDCESTDFVTVTVNPTILVDATASNADCCELGSIDLAVTGGSGNFTYDWSPNVSTTDAATDLEEGTYTITITDVAGCSTVVTETLVNTCLDCPEYITEEVITINLGDEIGICTTIPFLERDIYDVILDGSTYTAPMVICDIDTVIFYTYALTVNQGQSGPYEVDSWVCANGQIHSATVQDMTELVSLMQQWDPTGNWMHNPETYTISGGNTSSGYENLEITHIPSGVHATIMTNFTGIARGTDIAFTGDAPGTYVMEIEGPNCCQDEVTIIVLDPCEGYAGSAGTDATICAGESATLNATGGSSYKWSPATGLSSTNGASPLASPAVTTTYTVTITSDAGCVDTDEVTVEVSPSIALSVTATENADCCGGGLATIAATGGTGDYTYVWSNGETTTSASDLLAGDYSATVTDANGCSATVAIKIANDCAGCPDLFTEDVVTVPAGSTYDVCVPALLQDSDIYDVILDGSAYTGPMSPCDVDSIIFYTYALVVNQGNSGPYRLDSWTCNDVTVENIIVNDMAELTAIMNTNDPSGNWVHNPSTFTISGGSDGSENVYGNILITHLETSVQATIMTNFTGIAQGTEISVTGDAGEHELVIVNTAECCYDTLTVIFEVVCDLNVSADVTDGDCCGENGAVTFNVTGGDGNYTYTWDNGTTAANTATGLSAGTYKVTITDGNGCTQVGQINIGSDCSSCTDIFANDTVTFTEGQDAGVCVPVPFANRNIYDIILDGSDYTQPTTPCDVDSVIFYTYALVVNQGNSGPYNLDLWECNDVTLQNIVVQDMAELVSVMNANDPSGNWVLNPSTFTISGGEDDEENVYGDILITHMETSVQATIQTNITGVAFGFFVDTPDAPGEYEVEIYNNETCCTDMITVIVLEDDVVTPPYTSTIELSTPFGTAINNVCVPFGDAFSGSITSMSICGQPSNGSLSNVADGDACVDYTPSTGFFGQDQFCIEVCNAGGECGTFTVIVTVEAPVTPPTPGNDTIYFATAYETPLGTQCVPTNKYFDGPLGSISMCGAPANGTVQDIADGDACFNYVPNNGFSGIDEFCIEVCNDDGVCGTFTIIVAVGDEQVDSYEETIYLTTPFATTLTNICLPWTNAFPSGLESVMIGDMPDNGTLGNIANGDACVDYIPATGFAGMDEFIIVICDEQGTCGMFTVVITVLDAVIPTDPGNDSIYYTTPFETGLTGICMPWDKFFDDGFATISVCGTPANGTIANIADGDACIDYIPNDGFSGTDEFCIEVCSEDGICGTLIIFINVGEDGNTTVTVTTSTITLTTTEETPIDICLDPSELEGNPVQIQTCEDPSNGVLTPVNGSATCITYMPTTGFIGSDDFCLILCDDANVCDTTFITIITNEATTECTVTAATISTTSNTTVCADDGVSDFVDVSAVNGTYENNAWIVTDPDGNVIALPTATPIDFEGSGAGLCLIWNVAYNGMISGLEVGVNANNFEGCFALSNVIAVTRNVGDDCDGMVECTDLIDSTPITTTECVEGIADVCLPISLEGIAALTVTDNGANYTAGFTACDLDTSLVYLYVTLPGTGNSGPYTLLSWTENGELHENVVFNTMSELLTEMNQWDAEGNWMLDEQTMTISGGQAGGTYSAMLVKQDATNTTTLIDYSAEVSANGTQVSLADGVHTLVFTDANGCTDMVEVTVDCADVVEPSDCDKLVEDDDDIALQTADCGSPVDVCFDLTFDDAGAVDIYINNLKYTGTPSSCDGGFGTAIGLLPGDYEVEFVDNTTGCRDTVEVMIACITSMTVTDTIYVNAVDTTCIDTSELPGTITSIQNVCPDNSGELVVFELQPETYCVTYDGMEIGNESACIVICDDYGFCDTTYVFVTVEERESVPSVVADVDTTFENTPIDIFVLDNDTLGVITSVAITTQPENGTATITEAGVATYTPNAGFCDETNGDVFTYMVCDDQGNCESAPVTVYVLCSEMQVFTGFSPNGDGVNDQFYISGLEAFPEARLSVFNRWGTEVYKSDNYNNDWEGTWKDKTLPDGTYFYVLDDGKGKVYSGYIQIQR